MNTSAAERRDAGAAAIELPLAVGLLLLPISLIVMLVPQWPERQTVARSAAKEAATLYANAPSRADGAELATASVTQAAANYGLPDTAMTLTLSEDWCRGCTVTASVTVDIPAIDVPFVGAVGAFTYTSSSSARIDDYRNMAAGDAP